MKSRNFYLVIAIAMLLILNGITVNADTESILQKISQDIIGIVQKVNPAVVEITAISEIDIFDEDGKPLKEFFGLFEELSNKKDLPKRYKQKNIGSGIIIDKEGYIVTTASVIHNAHDIRILLADGRKLKAKLIGIDAETDIAVLNTKATNLPIVPLGNSDDVISGALVVAVGRSYGHTPTYAFGIANGFESLPGGPICDMIKLNINVSPGNSGGAVVNTSGELVGIISAMLAEPQITRLPTQSIPPRSLRRQTRPQLQSAKSEKTNGALRLSDSAVPIFPDTSTGGNIFRQQVTSFAIPINTANKIARELIAHGKIRRGWLGVWIKQLVSATGTPTGVQIIQFAEDSPAARAGLKLNDIVIGIDDKAVRTTNDLKYFVANSRPNTEVKLKILRAGKELSFNVKLGSRKN
ncbi:MAG: S1C family serine protease [Candidatus Poribacteria bacterium]